MAKVITMGEIMLRLSTPARRSLKAPDGAAGGLL